jgi:PAS domain-containing protein
MAQQQSYFPNPQAAMEMYQNAAQAPMAALLASSSGSYGNVATTPISPFNISASQPAQMNTTPTLPQTNAHGVQTPQQPQQSQHHIPFDPSDPAIFNFNIDGLNFGNRYGALEFGMLQTMSNGVNDAPLNEVVTPLNHVPSYSLNFGTPSLFDQNAMMNMNYNAAPAATAGRHPPSNPELKTPHNTPIIKSADVGDATSAAPYAYTIGAPQRPNSLASASPVSLAQDAPGVSENNGGMGSPGLFASGGQFAINDHHPHHLRHVGHQHSLAAAEALHATAHPLGRKRAHNADSVYGRIRSPYSYHQGWHRLFSYIKAHFNKENVQRIAQYVSVIRPPLTAFAQSLSVPDLIFMETTLQRQLYEYREFIKATGTPTLLTRRDGTILAVSEEFCKMTRWSEGVLLGRDRNMNVNRGQWQGGHKFGIINHEDKNEASGGEGPGVLISEIFEQQ